jgi:DNA-directed RNA polymerase specialized sigma24 family protein
VKPLQLEPLARAAASGGRLDLSPPSASEQAAVSRAATRRGTWVCHKVASPAPGPEVLAVGALTRVDWWETVSAGLSDREWCVTLYRVGRMPVRQMARRLGISEKSVRNTWERAKRKLRQRLVLDEIR